MMTRACHFFLGGVPFSPVIVESRADLIMIILNHYGFFIVSHFSALRVVQYKFFLKAHQFPYSVDYHLQINWGAIQFTTRSFSAIALHHMHLGAIF